jgi:hypothetical protein
MHDCAGRSLEWPAEQKGRQSSMHSGHRDCLESSRNQAMSRYIKQRPHLTVDV